MNLLSNAIDALQEGMEKWNDKTENHNPPLPMIKICTKSIAPDRVEIRIADNGLGMTETVLAQMFNPFFTTKPIGKGTGVGLAISRSIVVEKHGGQLQAFSEPGQGAEFVIQIPIRRSIALSTSSQSNINSSPVDSTVRSTEIVVPASEGCIASTLK
jgi:signal transduction histidine kinase